MTKTIGGIVAAAGLVGASLLFGQQTSSAAPVGRWQVAAGANDTVLVDTISGETWRLTHVIGSGSSHIKWRPLPRQKPATQPVNDR